MFIWLGSGRAKKNHIAESGQLLDQAAKAGLPVPPGAFLLDAFYRLLVDERVVDEQNGRIRIPDPELVHNTLLYSTRLPPFNNPVNLSLIPDDNQTWDSVLCIRAIDLNNSEETIAALQRLWSIGAGEPAGQRDVLVTEVITAAYTGTVLSAAAEETDEVILGPANLLSSGVGQAAAAAGNTMQLPRLRPLRVPKEDAPPFLRRLQMLLRGVRRTVGPGNWQIFWADDGHICRLTGINRYPV